MAEYILEMNGITKTFPGVKALDNVNLKVKKGEIHALVGENGAEAELVGGRELAGVGIFRNSDVHNDTS